MTLNSLLGNGFGSNDASGTGAASVMLGIIQAWAIFSATVCPNFSEHNIFSTFLLAFHHSKSFSLLCLSTVVLIGLPFHHSFSALCF